MTAHRIFFFSQTVWVKTVSVFQTGQFLRLLVLSSNVPLLSLFAVPNILYLNHPPLNMSYWLACVPYFRIKDAKRESDLAVLLLPLCMHIHTNTHISFLYLHTHTHTQEFFFSHDEATDILCLISKAWLVEDTGQTQWGSFICVSIFFVFLFFLPGHWQGGRGQWRVLVRGKILTSRCFSLVS